MNLYNYLLSVRIAIDSILRRDILINLAHNDNLNSNSDIGIEMMHRHCDKCNLEVPHGTVLATLCVDGAAHHLVDNIVPPTQGQSINVLLVNLLNSSSCRCLID